MHNFSNSSHFASDVVVNEAEHNLVATPPSVAQEADTVPASGEPEAAAVDRDTQSRSTFADDNWVSWERNRRALGQESQADFEGSRTKLKRAAAMLAIEIAHRTHHDWQAEVEGLGLHVPTSKHAYMAATAATFGTQAQDKTAKEQRAKFLDRTALAVENLVGKVQSDSSAYPRTEAGVATLVEIIDDAGGLSKLADEQRKAKGATAKPKTEKRGAIALDPASVREVRLQKAKALLAANAPNIKAVSRVAIIHDDGETQRVAMVVPATREEEEGLLLHVNATDRLVDLFGELFKAGTMVHEDKTEILKAELDDPEDPEDGFRPAFRHFVFADHQPVVISPILTNASVVVIANPREAIFPNPLGQVCHLRTQQRRIAEANIADPERRAAFSAEIRQAAETQHGVCRLWLTTQAAANSEDNDRNVGVLVEPLKSARGNLPLNVDESRFNPKFTGAITIDAWRTRNETFVAKHAKAAGSAEKLDHSFGANEWKIASRKRDHHSDISGTSGSASVAVREDDFRLVSEAIAALPVKGPINASADPKTGLRFEFSTPHFDYKVFVPSRTPSGDRNAMLFRHFEVEVTDAK